MNQLLRKSQAVVRMALAFLREITDEAAYQRHCERMLASGRAPFSPQEFYAKFLVAKYSVVRRCC